MGSITWKGPTVPTPPLFFYQSCLAESVYCKECPAVCSLVSAAPWVCTWDSEGTSEIQLSPLMSEVFESGLPHLLSILSAKCNLCSSVFKIYKSIWHFRKQNIMQLQKLPDVSPVAETLPHLEPQVISQLNRTISILKLQLPILSADICVVQDVMHAGCWRSKDE